MGEKEPFFWADVVGVFAGACEQSAEQLSRPGPD